MRGDNPLTDPRRRASIKVLLAGGLAAAGMPYATAQAWPSKPLRMVIPFAPGGGTDILGRIVAAKLGEAIGQNVVVENRGGAGGRIGMTAVATAPGDGHTIMMVSSSYSVNAAVYKMDFDPVKDLAPVIQIAAVPTVLAAMNSLPASNVQELVRLARSKPGSVTFASSGPASSPHLAGELLAMLADAKLVHVPYKGGNPAMMDVIGGQVNLLFGTVTQMAPHIRSGKLKPIAISGAKRARILPDVPTFAEAGLPGHEMANWFGILAPGSTPKPIVAELNRHLNRLLGNPEVREKMDHEGAEPVGGSAEDFEKQIQSEIEKFKRIVARANIKAE
ncbi:MAG TPA: tripartite tricarboxylate transporter substrate binding protein [Ramlibacter sp.]|nr:tripartite tricarboxylate transporter substrate binding protein [Ramlibacter sp.]